MQFPSSSSNIEIIDASYHLPANIITSRDIENKYWIKSWFLEKLTWVKQRHHRNKNEYPSTLAAEACRKIIDSSKHKIDLIIFASTSRDVTEPATANIVQSILWLNCPVFDTSNACNSFLTWLQISQALIKSWQYKKILLCTWETPSITINHKAEVNSLDFIVWTTLWDAWAAFLLWNSNNPNTWIRYEYFSSEWKYWEDICVKWWWARSPRWEDDDTYFKSHLDSSITYFKDNWYTPFLNWLKVTWWKMEDINKIIFHQASRKIFTNLIKISGFPKEKVITTLQNYWNTASASIPLAFALEKEKWNIQKWDKIVFICPAAWLSYWIIFMEI